MNSVDSQILESYVPVYDVVPEDWEDARPFLVEQLKRLAFAVNIREIGWFLDEELLSGKAFIPGINNVTDGGTSQQYRQILRRVVDFGQLPVAGLKSVPHMIAFDQNFTLISLTASATDPVAFNAIPIPYATPAALNQNVALYMDSVNVNILTGIDMSRFTRTFVVIEYLQEL